MIYSKEILSLKQEKKSLKKHICQLLRALNRDSEENEEYSEQEWEEIPRPKSRVKRERFNLVISIWHPIPFSED